MPKPSRSPPLASIGQRLAYLRERAGISQLRLAELAELAGCHVGLIERGRRTNISIVTAGKLCRALGARADWLERGLGDPPTEAEVAAALERASKSSTTTPPPR